jgi:hypothetical protein
MSFLGQFILKSNYQSKHISLERVNLEDDSRDLL